MPAWSGSRWYVVYVTSGGLWNAGSSGVQVNVTGGKSYEPRLDIIAILKFPIREWLWKDANFAHLPFRYSILVVVVVSRQVKDFPFEGNFSRRGVFLFFFFLDRSNCSRATCFERLGRIFCRGNQSFFPFFDYTNIYGILRELLPWMKIRFLFWSSWGFREIGMRNKYNPAYTENEHFYYPNHYPKNDGVVFWIIWIVHTLFREISKIGKKRFLFEFFPLRSIIFFHNRSTIKINSFIKRVHREWIFSFESNI